MTVENTELENNLAVESQDNEGTEQVNETSEASTEESLKVSLTESKEEARERSREGQIKSAQDKISNGELELEDLPKWLQSEVKPTKSHDFDDEAPLTAVEIAKQQIAIDNKFAELSKQVPSEKVESVNELLNSFYKKGFDKAEALEMAMLKSGVSITDAVQEAKDNKIANSSLPTVGQEVTRVKAGELISNAEFDKLSQSKKSAYIKQTLDDHGELLFK